jgi:hypothetical protein
MSHPKIIFVLAAMLILISLLCTAVPARSASAIAFHSKRLIKKELTPTFSRECAPLTFRAWHWAWYAARRLSISKGMALPDRMGGL